MTDGGPLTASPDSTLAGRDDDCVEVVKVRAIGEWVPGQAPRPLALPTIRTAAGVRWFDVDSGGECAGEIFALLSPACEGLREEMIEDLLTPDEEPNGKTYSGCRIRLASSFSAATILSDKERGRPGMFGFLRLEPMELLASDTWLITCVHPHRVFKGAHESAVAHTDSQEQARPQLAAELREHVARQWEAGPGTTGGDLGTLVLHELALSYVPAYRRLGTWLEDWELGLYLQHHADRQTLIDLWGSMAILRDWLNPLNRVGLRTDPDRAWLCVTDHARIRVDDRIDKALKGLGELGTTLRATFALLHGQEAEHDRERREVLQRRMELIATGFLVPTLIVGFYGANTWIPGKDQYWGFWVMVAALVMFSLIALSVVSYWHAQQRREEARAAEERAELRKQLGALAYGAQGSHA